jgi:hypothetical protein
MAPSNTPTKIQVSFSDDSVKYMLELLRLSVLPDKPPIPASDEWKHGISLSYLRKMKKMFESEWSWDNLAAELNHYDNYIVPMGEGADAFNLHFIHVRSPRNDAVPLLLLHGWPGMFVHHGSSFTYLMTNATRLRLRVCQSYRQAHKPASWKESVSNLSDVTRSTTDRSICRFHVVVPSLPGFFLSSHPQREGWTIIDNARVFDQLMVNVLGYPKYFVHGGDWVSLTFILTELDSFRFRFQSSIRAS